MDEGVVTSEKCWSGIEENMPETSARIELVDQWTSLNVLERKICKLNPKILTEEKSWRTWNSNQNIVMLEALVQNVAMGGTFVKNFVMHAKN